MPEKEEKAKPNGGAPPEDPDKDFWEAHGVTDDDEKEAIRARARVLVYDRYRTREEVDDAKNKKKKSSNKPWYKED